MSGASCAIVIIEANRLRAEVDGAEKLFTMEMGRQLQVRAEDRQVLLRALQNSTQVLSQALATAYANVGPPHDHPDQK